jgi:hypothetical protein
VDRCLGLGWALRRRICIRETKTTDTHVESGLDAPKAVSMLMIKVKGTDP